MNPDDRIEIAQQHPKLHLNEARLRRVIASVLAGEAVALESFSLVLTGHDEVHTLNRDYLSHDYQTDVLSFSLSDGTSDAVEGEVYVDLDTAMERHAEFDATFEEEAVRYVVHGLLHLIGYDDATPQERQVMHEKENVYLAAWHTEPH